MFPEGASGMVISALADPQLLVEVSDTVEAFFGDTVQDYVDMDANAYRQIVLSAQQELNRREIGRRLAMDRHEIIAGILRTKHPMVQSNLYLRAVRPTNSDIQESVGWHRESFFGPDMRHSINFWMPIDNVTPENSIRFIPNSHLIPDSAIRSENRPDESVKRYSAGHKIGLLYSPKEIISGVDLSESKPLKVSQGACAIFSGALIHGAGENRSEQIRFSLDFRLISPEDLRTEKFHFASGKSYFEPL